MTTTYREVRVDARDGEGDDGARAGGAAAQCARDQRQDLAGRLARLDGVLDLALCAGGLVSLAGRGSGPTGGLTKVLDHGHRLVDQAAHGRHGLGRGALVEAAGAAAGERSGDDAGDEAEGGEELHFRLGRCADGSSRG